MQRNTSLIFTKQYSELYERLVHFKIDDYYIISINADFLQFHILTKNWENYEPISVAFEKIINEIYSNEEFQLKPLFHDMYNLDTILLIELLVRLKLDNFAIYHHSIVGHNEYRYWEEFENRVLDYYACENTEQPYNEILKSPKLDFDDYINYNYSH